MNERTTSVVYATPTLSGREPKPPLGTVPLRDVMQNNLGGLNELSMALERIQNIVCQSPEMKNDVPGSPSPTDLLYSADCTREMVAKCLGLALGIEKQLG